MKISIKQYAKTLLELAAGKSEQELSVVVKKFALQLKKDGQLKNAKKIMEKFSELYDKKNGIIRAEVTTRFKMEEEISRQMENFIRDKYEAKNVEIINVINADVEGGMILKVGDEILDASVAGSLKKMKKELIK